VAGATRAERGRWDERPSPEHWRPSWRSPVSPRSRTPSRIFSASSSRRIPARPPSPKIWVSAGRSARKPTSGCRACCNPIYAALDALEDILTELRPDPASSSASTWRPTAFAAKHARAGTRSNYFAAEYTRSLTPAARAGAARQRGPITRFTEEVVRDPAIGAFPPAVSVRGRNPELSAQVAPAQAGAACDRPLFTDGRQVTRLRESARGDYQDPYSEGEIRAESFAKLARRGWLSAAGVARVETLVDRLEQSAAPGRSGGRACEEDGGA